MSTGQFRHARLLAVSAMAVLLSPVGHAISTDRHLVGVGGELGEGAYIEFSGMLSEAESSAWVGDIWMARRGGGLKLSWNQAIRRGDSDEVVAVRKVFAAVDQGRDRMQRLTLGVGMEREAGFAGAYLTHRLSGAGRSTNFAERIWVTDTLQDDGSRIVDTSFERTTSRTTTRAFDHGAGMRAGRHFDGLGVTLSGGADYEWGRQGARQSSLSMELQKRVGSSPLSVALRGEASRFRDRVTGSDSDQRVWLLLRYRFGGGYASARPGVAMAPANTSIARVTASEPAPRAVTRTVTTVVPASAEAFFGFDSSTLGPQAQDALDEVAARLNRDGYAPPIRITGHTCDIGDAQYNLGLSRRRANAVTGFLVSRGVPAGSIVTEGRGEAEPRYPNTRESRHRNRRVEIAYEATRSHEETTVLPQIAPPAEPIAADPALPGEAAWVRRALRNSLPHKLTVAGYRAQTTRTTIETVREIVPRENSAPVAVDDLFFVSGRTPSLLSVLANDFDPDGDPFWIIEFTQPSAGSLVLQGDQLRFSPYGIFLTDFFSYTIEDPFGARGSAIVTLVDP